MNQETINDLLEYIRMASTPYQAVTEGVRKLKAAGFTELSMREAWNLTAGGSYYVKPYPTTLFAFTIGCDWKEGQNFRIAAAHTDQPGFRIKPNAAMAAGKYLKLDTQVYGGPILNTWMDRPLSIAGRVALRSDDLFHPIMKIIDIKKPVLTIPNLAIHMNRDVNKGVELKKQIDMLPIGAMIKEEAGQIDDKGQFLIKYLADYLNVDPKNILDYDIYVYNTEEGCLLGFEEEFISAPRLDNLTSVLALLKGIIAGRRKEGINVIALYDNEEIGSRSKQGADSSILNLLLEKIYSGIMHSSRAELFQAIPESMLLSVDVAHAVHPNRPEKYDPNNHITLNDGVGIKIDCNQKYTFDTEAVAIIQQICEKEEIRYQKFVNHSDMPGGSTLGPLISSWLPVKTVDMGVPILAMHSSREMMGVADQEYLEKLICNFFKS